MEKTSVSFYIMTYNQEKFVASAIQAAFAQNYQELEIVISDDCSNDNTWNVILETVEKYQSIYNRKVILNRNEKNLGICRHINKIISLCSHDIIVCSAGDDISFPDRVRKTVAQFNISPNIMLVSSQVRYIDEQGSLIAYRHNKRYNTIADVENIASGKALPVGCAIACRRECYNFLNKRHLPNNCNYEDIILALRACLIGEISQINEPLVWYRISEGSLTNFVPNSSNLYSKKKAMALQTLLAIQAQLNDLYSFLEHFPEKRNKYKKIIRILKKRIDQKEQSLWIYQYSLSKILLLKLCSPLKGKFFFRYLVEVFKKKNIHWF